MGPSSPRPPLQLNRKLPALSDNLAVRYSLQHPTDIEKLKSSDAPDELGLPDRPGLQTSVPLTVMCEEKLNLTKRNVKRKQLEELVKARFPQGQLQVPGKLAQRKSKPTDFRNDESKSKAQGLLQGSQFSSMDEMASPGVKLYLYPSLQKSVFPRSRSLPTAEESPKPCSSAAESPSMQELRRLQEELSGCIQKIEGVATKDRLEEGLDQTEAEQNFVARQEQAVRTTLVLYSLLEQVKEIQEDLDKLSPHQIQNTTEELDSLLEKTQSLRKKKKIFPRIRSQFPVNFPKGVENTSISSLSKEKKFPLTKNGSQPAVRTLLEEKRRCSSMFPLLQILNDELREQSGEGLSSLEQSNIVKVKPASVKAKAVKKQPLASNEQSIWTSTKSQQI